MLSKINKGNEIGKMNSTELKEVFKLLEHEHIHLSEDNTNIAFVGKYILTNIDLLPNILQTKELNINFIITHLSS